MNRSMITAATTMAQLQQQLNTISNNIANSETIGFKKRQTKFSDLLYQQVNNQNNVEATKETPAGIRVGNGAKVVSTNQILDVGAIKATDRMLDFALIQENLLFQIQGNDGEIPEQYTRSGAFYLTPVGNNDEVSALVTADGRSVMGQNGPITIPSDAKSIDVDSLGNLTVTLTNDQTVNIDQLTIVQAVKPQYLQQAGDNRFYIPNEVADESVIQQYNGMEATVQQGALEQSNVDVGQEMVQLLEMQRSFQLNARAISYVNEMMGLVNGIR